MIQAPSPWSLLGLVGSSDFWLAVLVHGLVVATPLAHAFLRGLTSARDPMHRVVPASPWSFWWRGFWPAIRWWCLLWVAALSVLFARSVSGRIASDADAGMLYSLLWSVGEVGFHLGFGLLLLGSCVVLAPVCARLWPLAISTPLVACAVTAILFIAIAEMPFGLRHLNFLFDPELGHHRYTLEVTPHIYFIESVFLFLLAAMWAWARGKRWFRFEE